MRSLALSLLGLLLATGIAAAAEPSKPKRPLCAEADLVLVGSVQDVYAWRRQSSTVDDPDGGTAITNSCGEFLATISIAKRYIGEYEGHQLKIRDDLGEWCDGAPSMEKDGYLLWLARDDSMGRVLASAPLFTTGSGGLALDETSARQLGLNDRLQQVPTSIVGNGAQEARIAVPVEEAVKILGSHPCR